MNDLSSTYHGAENIKVLLHIIYVACTNTLHQVGKLKKDNLSLRLRIYLLEERHGLLPKARDDVDSDGGLYRSWSLSRNIDYNTRKARAGK